MSAVAEFKGLTMPVFTAFGWAGEEAAQAFAMSQLEIFIERLYRALSREARTEMPFYGMDMETQVPFLATNRITAEGPYVVFGARPSALEIRLSITDQAVLNKGLKAAEREPEAWYRIVNKLGPEWTLHLKQSMVDEETGEVSNYQDLFKESVESLDRQATDALFSRAAFLNSENKWVTPLYFTQRIQSDRVAAMGVEVTKVMADEVDKLLNIITWFTRRVRGSTATPKAKTKKTPKQAPVAETVRTADPEIAPTLKVGKECFNYVADLKPLHIRKGFINMTEGHWPFFALNARTESREVEVRYDGKVDKDCAVWRLQPSEIARLVLSERVQSWLENNFEPNSQIMTTAEKTADDAICITLSAVK